MAVPTARTSPNISCHVTPSSQGWGLFYKTLRQNEKIAAEYEYHPFFLYLCRQKYRWSELFLTSRQENDDYKNLYNSLLATCHHGFPGLGSILFLVVRLSLYSSGQGNVRTISVEHRLPDGTTGRTRGNGSICRRGCHTILPESCQ